MSNTNLPIDEPTPSNALLAGTVWELVAFESNTKSILIPDEHRLWLEFDNDKFVLQSECNPVEGSYLSERDRITITSAVSHLVDCSSSMPGINNVEEAFLGATETINSYVIEDDELIIRYADGEIMFHRR